MEFFLIKDEPDVKQSFALFYLFWIFILVFVLLVCLIFKRRTLFPYCYQRTSRNVNVSTSSGIPIEYD